MNKSFSIKLLLFALLALSFRHYLYAQKAQKILTQFNADLKHLGVKTKKPHNHVDIQHNKKAGQEASLADQLEARLNKIRSFEEIEQAPQQKPANPLLEQINQIKLDRIRERDLLWELRHVLTQLKKQYPEALEEIAELQKDIGKQEK